MNASKLWPQIPRKCQETGSMSLYMIFFPLSSRLGWNSIRRGMEKDHKGEQWCGMGNEEGRKGNDQGMGANRYCNKINEEEIMRER